MTLALPGIRSPLRRSGGVKDPATAAALRAIEDWCTELATRLAKLTTGGSGITLPIAESDVTNLVADLAGKASTGHSHATFTSVAAGFVPASGGGTANFLRADGSFAVPGILFTGFGNGSDGALNFDGVATPIAGATLSGSTYTMSRPIHATTITIASGVILNPGGHIIHAQGAITGLGKIARNGGNAAANVGGAASATAGDTWLPGGNAGVNGGTAGGTNSAGQAACPGVFTNTGGGGGLANTNGTAGTGPGKGGGGGGSATAIGGAAGGISFGSVREFDWETDTCWDRGRDLLNAVFTCGSAGGSGGGNGAGNVGGGSGASGGWIAIKCRSISVTVEAIGGNGGNASGVNAGGGGAGCGGVIFVQYAEGSAPTVSVNGGTGGNGTGTGGNGGNGSVGVSRTWKVMA